MYLLVLTDGQIRNRKHLGHLVRILEISNISSNLKIKKKYVKKNRLNSLKKSLKILNLPWFQPPPLSNGGTRYLVTDSKGGRSSTNFEKGGPGIKGDQDYKGGTRRFCL